MMTLVSELVYTTIQKVNNKSSSVNIVVFQPWDKGR